MMLTSKKKFGARWKNHNFLGKKIFKAADSCVIFCERWRKSRQSAVQANLSRVKCKKKRRVDLDRQLLLLLVNAPNRRFTSASTAMNL